jgi:hypothetical protein
MWVCLVTLSFLFFVISAVQGLERMKKTVAILANVSERLRLKNNIC